MSARALPEAAWRLPVITRGLAPGDLERKRQTIRSVIDSGESPPIPTNSGSTPILAGPWIPASITWGQAWGAHGLHYPVADPPPAGSIGRLASAALRKGRGALSGNKETDRALGTMGGGTSRRRSFSFSSTKKDDEAEEQRRRQFLVGGRRSSIAATDLASFTAAACAIGPTPVEPATVADAETSEGTGTATNHARDRGMTELFSDLSGVVGGGGSGGTRQARGATEQFDAILASAAQEYEPEPELNMEPKSVARESEAKAEDNERPKLGSDEEELFAETQPTTRGNSGSSIGPGVSELSSNRGHLESRLDELSSTLQSIDAQNEQPTDVFGSDFSALNLDSARCSSSTSHPAVPLPCSAPVQYRGRY